MTPNPPISFQRAEYGGEAVSMMRCAWCGRGITDEFYRANGDMICPMCAARAQTVLPKNDRRVFLRSAGAGLLTAIAASLLYLMLLRLLSFDRYGIMMAFGAIGVGYAIGKTMRVAARGEPADGGISGRQRY